MDDRIYQGVERVEDFTFDERVASVFDDMIRRSVPFYDEVQRMVIELAGAHLRDGGVAYDVGCSTGTTIVSLAEAIPATANVEFVGIDPSAPMLEHAAKKMAALGYSQRVRLVQAQVQDLSTLANAQVVTMLYALQFVRPIERLGVLEMIRRSLRPGGCLLLAEKILADNRFARRLYIDLYHQHKRKNGYSDTEIVRKREALENVLIPYQNQENIELLKSAGFTGVEQAFRWYNFALYIAVAEQ